MPKSCKTSTLKIYDLYVFLLGKEFTIRQHIRASHLVRYLCIQHLAELLKLPPTNLKIIRNQEEKILGPPKVYFDTVVFPVDISLSHHGNWVGWAFSFHQDSGFPKKNRILN